MCVCLLALPQFYNETGPAHYSDTHSAPWVPSSSLDTVTYRKSFHPHHTYFTEEETSSREVKQLTPRPAG